MEGSISWEDFLVYAKEVLSLSTEIGDNWILKGCTDSVAQAYLAKQCLVYVNKSEIIETNTVGLDLGSNDDLEEILNDSSELTEQKQQHHLKGEYHVLYNISYGVPVLYFNLWKADGTLISTAELWHYVDGTLQKQIKESYWNMLTQQEHPILRRPFFKLHPCQTGSILAHPSANPLVTWLSTVAAAAPGLCIPDHYCRLIQHRI